MKALGEILGLVDAADSLILVEICRMGVEVPKPIDERTLWKVRTQLERRDPRVLLSVIHAVGVLEDVEALPDLIELLRHGSESVQRKALDVLRRLTRQRFTDSNSWWDWYDAESTWWREEAVAELERLRTGSAHEAAKSVMSVSRHRLMRHAIAAELGVGLTRHERDIVLLTCSALGSLQSWAAVSDLVECLAAEDAAVRAAAQRALENITGKALGTTAADWEEALHGNFE